jgi:hypothetical protein
LTVPQKNYVLNKNKKEHLKEFESSPGCFRGFCATCGSFMYWRSEREDPDDLDVCVGTLNQDVLLGERGKVFAFPSGWRVWCSREIKGVTDPGSGYGGGVEEEEGVRFVEGTNGKRMND